MTVSGTTGLLGIPLILQPWLPKPFPKQWLHAAIIILPLATFLCAPLEYHKQSREFHCRAYQVYFTEHSDIPDWCPNQYQQQLDDFTTLKLYKPSERVAISLHHLIEIVWLYFQDHKLYAKQRWKMLWTRHPNPSIRLAPPHHKRVLCRQDGPQNGIVRHYKSSYLIGTSGVQAFLSTQQEAIAALPQWDSFQRNLPLNDNRTQLYNGLHPSASINLSFTRTSQQWEIKQAIVYTPTIQHIFKIPTIIGYLKIPLSTAMYCGLQMDGALSPYQEIWQWSEVNLNNPTNIDNILSSKKSIPPVANSNEIR